MAVWFEPVSKIKTAGLPLISAVTSIKPKARLKRNGISTGSEAWGETGKPRVTARSKVTEHRLAVFKTTDSLTSRLAAFGG
jgi:hypothetical protein